MPIGTVTHRSRASVRGAGLLALVGGAFSHFVVVLLISLLATSSYIEQRLDDSGYVASLERNVSLKNVLSKFGIGNVSSVQSPIPPQSLLLLANQINGDRTQSLSSASEPGISNKSQEIVPSYVVRKEERVVSGVITSSLVEAARRVNVPFEVVDDFVDMFGEKIDFRRDLQPGDSFSAIYSQDRRSDGTWIGPARLMGASLRNNGKVKSVVRHYQQNGKFADFDETGFQMGQQFLRYPVQFTRVSSVFSDARLHPVLGIRRPHNGVDFAAPVGTPVRAVGDGIVESAGFFGDAGIMVKIKHDSTYSTAYLHLSKIAPGVKKGSRISRGDLIGNVGMTGLTSGPHLHFSLYIGGKYVDPMKAKLPLVASKQDPKIAQIVKVALGKLQSQHESIVVAQASLAKRQG